MSCCDKSGTYETPCPDCGGKVEWWYFSPDCRGNGPSSGINCNGCKKKFTADEWKNIEAKFAAEKRTEKPT